MYTRLIYVNRHKINDRKGSKTNNRIERKSYYIVSVKDHYENECLGVYTYFKYYPETGILEKLSKKPYLQYLSSETAENKALVAKVTTLIEKNYPFDPTELNEARYAYIKAVNERVLYPELIGQTVYLGHFSETVKEDAKSVTLVEFTHKYGEYPILRYKLDSEPETIFTVENVRLLGHLGNGVPLFVTM
jgi:hypothetical protein